MPNKKWTPQPILIFFDGVCVLCDGFVDWLILRDQQKIFRFAPLQGTTAQEYFGPEQRQKLESVLVWDEGQVLQKSDAILFVLSQLPRWRWAKVLRLIPRCLRDSLYDIVAKNRAHWFGQRDTCRLPTEREKERILP